MPDATGGWRRGGEAPYATPVPPVVDADWVRAHPGPLVLADVRWFLDGRSGYDAYLAGHLPGAVWVDVDTVLSAPPDPAGGRHPVPEPGEFAWALGLLGIGDGTTVVAYDADGGAYAARLVWLLRSTGRDAALLDGGLGGWSGAIETGAVVLPAARLTAVEWPARALRGADEVGAGNAVVLDARAAGRYSGEHVLPTDIRSGHIPGARSAPWSENLTPDGTFLPADQLRARYRALGVEDGADTVVYCGSGVTACHDLLALEHAGITGAALYPGSWSAWSADPSRRVATGEEPG
ncbi:sulfurtransferase [Streptomyces acidiscabies]|uniref:Sulfurtransferase n=6 Tax=Streptomyces acidiscabies TaxID=42234 RepID=A0AAP6EJ01_9ACTN|nr:sulfurtransferase [Streptomyces acidiscabies]MBP5942299.1 sulfurtransferase [Streptomyces sp. LBUM 1476]MBZ3913847.1 sulfurtransferase [Streptomyces acidiscabies]MDX2964474.1 sulfurtransferase [Streptomyces acidiscabies]MDX3022062.1 sulfurtransferase [Streptomyces acidiscabies]MDX3793626.1 sulfurtransferase [Streptomyces acidiscabies]